MATSIYWSGSFGGNTAGTYGRSATSSPSGNSVSSSNYLNSVKCYQSMSAGGYSSSKEWRISFYSKYSDSTYFVGSPSSYSSYVASTAMSSTKGKVSVDFSKNLSQFNNGSSSTSLYGKANTSHSSSSYMQQVWIRITYSSPSLTAPGAPTITQKNNGTYDASWTASTYSSGSGSPTYTLKYGSTTAASGLTEVKKTGLTIPGYGTSYSFTVVATYSGLTKTSSATSKTFTKPALNAPTNLKINNSTTHTGQTAPLTWTAGSFSSFLTGTMSYQIYQGSTLVATTNANATSYTIPESTTKGWGTSAVTLKIRGKGTGLSNTSQGSTLYSSYTSTVSYTYKPKFTTAPANLVATPTSGASTKLTWSAAVISSGGTITYSIRKGGTEFATTTALEYTVPESTAKTWGTSAVSLTVVATSTGADNSSASNAVSFTYSPTLSNPSNLKINNATSYTGQSATLTWTAATLSNGGAVTYSIRKDGTEFATATTNSYTITEATAKSWGASAVSLTVVAKGAGKTSSATSAVTFTYKPAYKTVKYYNGSQWIECIMYQYNGTAFVQGDPYYYTSATAKVETSHS